MELVVDGIVVREGLIVSLTPHYSTTKTLYDHYILHDCYYGLILFTMMFDRSADNYICILHRHFDMLTVK